MTIKQVFDYVDEVMPNAFSNAVKTAWLNEVEGKVQTEVFLNNETECFQYNYSADVTTPITFPDDHTIGIADKFALKQFRPGGKITMTPTGIYAGNAVTNAVIQSVNADGLVFADNTFSATGTTEVSTAISFDGSSCELLVEYPHSKIYGEYIIARIHYANKEYDNYSASMAMFNDFWGEFMRWFARTYCPAGRRK